MYNDYRLSVPPILFAWFFCLISLAFALDIFDIFNGAHAYRDKPYLIFARNSVNFYAGAAVSIRLALKIIKNFHLEEVSLMAKKYCYLFTEGNAKMRELLGGKGANLAEMTNIGLPVPQGFTISTEACTQYYEDGKQINPDIQAEIMEYIDKMEKICGKKFGDKENPLLVSVRSGARASMPGMMDTILNLGLNEEVVNVIAAKSNNPRWAWDC